MLDPVLLTFLAAFAGGYALGSVPFGLVIVRAAGLGDIRKQGSGNIGATNVLRAGYKGLAALTLILDAGKGAAAALIAALSASPEAAALTGLIAGASAILGHNFPVWLKFNGGKGVATTMGVLLATSPIVGVMAATTWIAMAVIFRYSSLAALVALSAAPVYALILGMVSHAAVYASLAALAWARHHANVARLIAGQEPKIGGAKTGLS